MEERRRYRVVLARFIRILPQIDWPMGADAIFEVKWMLPDTAAHERFAAQNSLSRELDCPNQTAGSEGVPQFSDSMAHFPGIHGTLLRLVCFVSGDDRGKRKK